MKDRTLLRQTFGVSLLLLAALFLLPLRLLPDGQADAPSPDSTAPEVSDIPTPTSPPSDDSPSSPTAVDRQLRLQVLQNGVCQELDLETYLTGVLRAEMPASFAPEALKAQVVAARTYTLYQLQNGGNHTDADICTNPACCQAWLDEETSRQNWGASADLYEEKIRTAVRETDGQAMFYSGEPILAVFHSSSSGLTRPAGQVWQNDLPYLQAVASPENAATIPNYYSRVEFSAEEFRTLIHAAYPNADLSGSLHTWLTQRVADDAGNVDTLCVGGITVRGNRLRGILGLRSACFDWAVENDRLVFFVTGYGHGVGMSQYGANAMANNGADWTEILHHYYSNISIHSFR